MSIPFKALGRIAETTVAIADDALQAASKLSRELTEAAPKGMAKTAADAATAVKSGEPKISVTVEPNPLTKLSQRHDELRRLAEYQSRMDWLKDIKTR